jgi:hypothetical protein
VAGAAGVCHAMDGGGIARLVPGAAGPTRRPLDHPAGDRVRRPHNPTAGRHLSIRPVPPGRAARRNGVLGGVRGHL